MQEEGRELRRMHDTGDYSISDLADIFGVSMVDASGENDAVTPTKSLTLPFCQHQKGMWVEVGRSL